MLGAMFLALIKNGILKLGISPWVQPIVIGGIIVVTVIIDVWQKKLSERLTTRAKLRRLALQEARVQAAGAANGPSASGAAGRRS
jgi:preprotein translocase subunit SecY